MMETYDRKVIPLYANHMAELGNGANIDVETVAPVPIDFDFQLHSFNNVDLGGEVADMDLSARLSWYDSRFTDFKPGFGNKIYIEMDKIWHPNLFISNQILDANVKDQPADCIIMTDQTCPNGSWYKTNAENKLCSNVRCVGVIRVIAKFGAKPQAFPYDIQKPNLEIKSKNYPSSMVKLHTNSLNIANKAPIGNLTHGQSDVDTVKHQLFISNSEWNLRMFSLGVSDFNDRIAGDEVSALKIEFIIVRNTPKLNLTLYVPIFILMVLFLGSILVPIASGEKLGFQITLLLASYFYFDFFQTQLPPFEKTTDTPMALIFFMVIIINQFGTIIVSIWEQRLETNGWDRACFNKLVQMVTRDLRGPFQSFFSQNISR